MSHPYSSHTGPKLGFALCHIVVVIIICFTLSILTVFITLVCIDFYVLYCLLTFLSHVFFRLWLFFFSLLFFLCFVVDLCPGLFVLQMRAGVQLTWQEGLR